MRCSGCASTKTAKIPITELVRAIGFKTDAEILELFGDDDRVAVTLEKDACKTYEEAMLEILPQAAARASRPRSRPARPHQQPLLRPAPL